MMMVKGFKWEETIEWIDGLGGNVGAD